MSKHDYFDTNTAVGVARRKWIEALRSGKYKQGKGELGDPDTGFCCLGVGCVVLDIPFYSGDSNNSEFATAVGLHTADSDFSDDTGEIQPLFWNQPSLMQANDDTNAGFKRIAKFIETHPEYVFAYP